MEKKIKGLHREKDKKTRALWRVIKSEENEGNIQEILKLIDERADM
jgi:hypothetical protein